MESSLNLNVLVLNKLYCPIHITTARRAFILLAKEHAEVVCKINNMYNTYDLKDWIDVSRMPDVAPDNLVDFVHTISLKILVPRIIRVLFYDKIPLVSVKFNRKNIFERDEYTCQYCGRRCSESELSIDHIFPSSLGGKSDWDNVVVACHKCNSKKGGRLPAECGMRLLKRPYAPKKNPQIEKKLNNIRYSNWKPFLEKSNWVIDFV